MPGPGPHLMYALGVGVALTGVSDGRFGPHHSLTYALNAFFGPDLGSFSEWLASTFGAGQSVVSAVADVIHHPFLYILALGFPLALLYSWLSAVLLRKGLLDSGGWAPLTRRQCFLLVSAGSLSHFFLDHLFEENGHSAMYTWILSTGWWVNRAPINLDAVIIIGFLCASLIIGFIYISRGRPWKPARKQATEQMKLILAVAGLYSLWCAGQIYWAEPRRPAVGEEADLGVIVFLAIYFFLPLCLCLMSMHSPNAELDLCHV